MNLQDAALRFSEIASQEGYRFDCQIISGEVEVLQILVEGFEELPIYLSATDFQILCIVYLWEESEVKPESRSAMIETMMEMNIPMPLSSFSKIDDRYVVFGALSINSNFDEVVHEVVTLSENAVEAIEILEEYLV